MKPFMEENLAEEHRNDITRELTDIRLQEEALKIKVYQPGLFTHTMRRLGQWLIARGEKMVKRYEVPANSTKTSKQRYAH
jgi:hypothetical protein